MMTLHPIELAFLAAAFIFLCISIYGLRQARMDASALNAARVNGPRKAMAETAVDQGWAHVFVGLTMAGAAILSLILEPPPPDYTTLPQSLVGMVAWILVAGLLSLASLLAKSARQRVSEYAPMEIEGVTSSQPAPGPDVSLRDGAEHARKTADDEADTAELVVTTKKTASDKVKAAADKSEGESLISIDINTQKIERNTARTESKVQHLQDEQDLKKS
jgi:hypothetical protein